jgi:hypothetical protein
MVFLIEVKDVRIGPPGGGDDVFHDPGEGLGSFGLASFGPIPGSNGRGHGHYSTEGFEVCLNVSSDGPLGCSHEGRTGFDWR